MTAEIAILNRGAVALAADSAVTISGEKDKIYNSANKLFTLSKYHPVGVMVYGNANLASIPWETIIKMYRNNLGESKKDTLEEYAEEFLSYLTNQVPQYVSESSQEAYVYSLGISYFSFVYERISRICREFKQSLSADDSELDEEAIIGLVDEVLNSEYTRLKKLAYGNNFNSGLLTSIGKTYRKQITAAREKVFDGSLGSRIDRLLNKLVTYVIVKERETPHHSGIVVAGFGCNDIFPGLVSYLVDGVAMGRLKYKQDQKLRVGIDTSASVVPFAQKEMVHTFMEGMDPQFRSEQQNWLTSVLTNVLATVLDDVAGVEECTRDELRSALNSVLSSALEDYDTTFREYSRDRYWSRMLDVVDVMPKEELAAVAEALVNITAFKRKVSGDSETVGGPIDVAVISKGDGFIWIKRKHYFNTDLNQHFIRNYFRNGAKTNGTTEQD